jgi:hypothetical protein
MRDTHANRHILQVVCEHTMVQLNYGNPLLSSMLLVVQSGTAHTWIDIPENGIDLACAIRMNLLNRPLPADTVSHKRLVLDAMGEELDRKHIIKKLKT